MRLFYSKKLSVKLQNVIETLRDKSIMKYEKIIKYFITGVPLIQTTTTRSH